jgi:hypothetical protein
VSGYVYVPDDPLIGDYPGPVGAASTLNPVEYEPEESRPIGFLWKLSPPALEWDDVALCGG